MAERVGFEPTIPVKVCPLSRRIVSTTHAPLRVGQILNVSAGRAQTLVAEGQFVAESLAGFLFDSALAEKFLQ
jgi:hypothetical protein